MLVHLWGPHTIITITWSHMSQFSIKIANSILISNGSIKHLLNKITFIKASKGEKTIATLFCWSTAGSWKHKDFPDPVGIDINTSWFPVTRSKHFYIIQIWKKIWIYIIEMKNTTQISLKYIVLWTFTSFVQLFGM